MKYFCGPTNLFDPAPEGELLSESSDESIQIWKAEDYNNENVSEITKEAVDNLIVRPSWNGV